MPRSFSNVSEVEFPSGTWVPSPFGNGIKWTLMSEEGTAVIRREGEGDIIINASQGACVIHVGTTGAYVPGP